MTLAQLLADYGYLAVFAGSLLEGESMLVLAGFAGHQGYLSFPLVVLIALCGGVLGDQFFFFLGRRYGEQLIRRFPRWQPGAQRVNRMLLQHQVSVIVSVRFMYGLRIVGPLAIGMSEVPAWRFILFNVIGAALWAPLIAGAGYLFGQTLQWLFADIKRYEEAALLLIIATALLFGLLRQLRRRP